MGSYRPHKCPVGYFCPSGTANYKSFPCADGTYAAFEGNARALGLTDQSQCVICPIGHYCQTHTARPQPCPTGSYMPTEGARYADPQSATANSQALTLACLPCEAGFSCPGQGLSATSECPVGTYSPAKSSSCFECRVGHLCLEVRKTQAQYEEALCPAGSYCAGLAQPAVSCPLGFYCYGSGAVPAILS